MDVNVFNRIDLRMRDLAASIEEFKRVRLENDKEIRESRILTEMSNRETTRKLEVLVKLVEERR